MSRTKITAIDKAYIVGNNDTMLVRQMSAHLDLSVDAIRQFIKEQNMQTFSAQNKTVSTKELQPDQQKFIKNNCAHLTVSELARAVKNTNYAVGKYLKDEKLKAKKRVLIRDIPQIVTTYDVVTQKITRPDAVYSNKQFNN